jgi:hypothetical protein
MSSYGNPMMAALNAAFHERVIFLFRVLADSNQPEKAKVRFATGLARARAAYEDAEDAITAATADEE